MTVSHADPVVQTFRSEITALDARLLKTINERIAAVAQLHAYKNEHDLPTVDPRREEDMLRYLSSINAGPISEHGLAELYAFVLALVKREVARG